MTTAGNAKRKKCTVMEIVRRNIRLKDKPITEISGQPIKSERSVLFFADIQGPDIIKTRSIRRNISIAGNPKVIGICNALKLFNHNVVVYSLGSPAERSGKFYPAYKEAVRDIKSTSIDILYGATIDNRLFRGTVGAIYAAAALPIIINRYSIDTIIVYNITFLSLAISVVSKIFGIKVFLEYEDSARASRETLPLRWKKVYRIHELIFSKIASGVFAANNGLIECIGIANSYCLPGILNEDLTSISLTNERQLYKPNQPIKLIYAGGLDASKGIDRFIEAIDSINEPIKMVVCGIGVLDERIKELCRSSRHDIQFLGLISRDEMIKLMIWADVGINPHRNDLHNGGTWPFKVVEYLGACGTVFCCNSGEIPKELRDKLFMYDGNEVSEIREAFLRFLDRWPELSIGAADRRMWAIKQFSVYGVGLHLHSLLMNDSATSCSAS